MPLTLCLVACSASADVEATYSTSFGTRLIEVGSSGWLRVEDRAIAARGADESYSLTSPEGRNFTVFRHGGKWIVAGSRDFTDWLNRAWHPMFHVDPPEGLFAPTGEERIGAWTGTAYKMKHACGSWSHIVVMRGRGLDVFGKGLRRNFLAAAPAPLPPCERQAIDLIGSGVPLFFDD